MSTNWVIGSKKVGWVRPKGRNPPLTSLVGYALRANPPYEASDSRLRDELLVHVDFKALDAALVAVAGVLDAAERRLGRRDRDAVHADHAGLERIADRGRGLRRGREGVGREPELERVRPLHHLVERLEGDDRRDRPERLLGHDLGVIRHVGDDGRLEEEALVARAVAAGDDLAAAVLR